MLPKTECYNRYMQKKTVLLVDEDEIFRAVYARVLEQAGFVVVHADGAAAALTQLEECDVDVVISEVLLPGKNGLKLLKDIRIKTTSNTKPIILLTVLEAADIGLYQSLQQSLGVRAYLVKQKSTPNELIAAVNYSLSTS